MKIIAIGDIHGRSIWKNIVSANSYDKVVFLGDYFDSFDIHTLDQIDNFKVSTVRHFSLRARTRQYKPIRTRDIKS